MSGIETPPRPPGPARAAPGAAKLAGSFLAGAKGRLLPPSVPFRFFGAAVTFHLLAWLALAAGAIEGAPWRAGLGWPLAALHLVTLGTLAASAIGASLQLLPVATRQPLRSHRLLAALWWLYVPGVALVTLGMGLMRPPWLAVGAGAVLLALAAWGLLLALNLRGARGMPGVVLHGWGALAALVLLGLSAAALVAWWLGRPLLDRDSARALHLAAGLFGVMGLLALGLSYILVPMFALAGVPDERRQVASGVAALAAIALAGAAAAGVAPVALRALAIAAGAAALVWHLRLMQQALARGLRRDLGRALRLMRIGWGALALALGLALAGLFTDRDGAASAALGRLFVLALVGGWLLSFLFGVLQRILPFLASMHAARGHKRAPTPSMLAPEWPPAVHAVAHLLALGLLALAAVTDSAALALAGAAVGAGGAVAFALFFVTLMWRLRRCTAAATQAPAA